MREFIAAILKYSQHSRFLKNFETFAEQIAQLGMVNSLSQTLLKFTVPGMPDIYQGCEMWDFSLVDPDNRRPVDYAVRKEALVSLETVTPAELLENWRDGRIKLFLTQKLLNFRRQNFDLFAKGDYVPLSATGAFSESVFAFARRFENRTLVVIAPRLSSKVGFPPVGKLWKDTAAELPFPNVNLRDIFTGREWNASLAESLRELPFAVFVVGT